jgi:hypothetical protein
MVWGKKYGSDTPSHSALTSGIEGSSPRLITHEHQQSTQLRSWFKKNAPAPLWGTYRTFYYRTPHGGEGPQSATAGLAVRPHLGPLFSCFLLLNP